MSLTHEQVGELREAFAMFDRNGDGSISVEELSVVMRSLGQNPSDEELRNVIRDVDQDGNGCIDFAEFITLMVAKQTDVDTTDDLETAFAYFDKDNKGYLRADELKSVLTVLGDRLTEAEVDDMVREAEADNGRIDYKKFASRIVSSNIK